MGKDLDAGELAGAAAAMGTETAARREAEMYRATAAELATATATATAALLELEWSPGQDWRGLRALALEIRAAADRALSVDQDRAGGSPDCWAPR